MLVDVTQEIKKTEKTRDNILLGQIEELDKSLIEYFADTLVIDNALTRKLVSFQAVSYTHLTLPTKRIV